MTKKELASKLKLIIFERFDRNASEYARTAGISTSTLYSYQNEDAFPGKANLKKLIKGAKMTEEEFFGEETHEKVKDYDKEVALRHKPVHATSWGNDRPDRRKEDRRRMDQRIDDIKKKMMGSLTAAFDDTTTAGKEYIKRSIDFLKAEVINYKKGKLKP